MTPVVFFAFLTFISTLGGGLVGLHYKDRLHLILGFTAGVLLGVVAFEVLPEIMELVAKTQTEPFKPMLALAVGFLAFHILEKVLLIHHAKESEYGIHKHPTVGQLSALALAGHSFLDGVGIGLGFQVSSIVGILIAVAVIAHDFSDGLNTVSLVLAHQNTTVKARIFLLLDASTPLAGALSTRFFVLSQDWLLLYLGLFAGFLLYLGASDILPEAHSQHSSLGTICMTLLGTTFIFLVTRFI